MFRSGSPRPLSKPRNTFALYSTPLSRAVRPLCPIRRLARRLSYSIDISDIRSRWETHINEKPTEDIRYTCARLRNLYEKGNEHYKTIRLSNLFPFESENNETKIFDDYLPKFEEKKLNENETNLPKRYPKILEDSSEFYAQFTHNNMSIMKKRPYESSENSNEGNSNEVFNKRLEEKFLFLGPSPKRTLISRQNLIKTKSPVKISLF
jgi:hypothetical protein